MRDFNGYWEFLLLWLLLVAMISPASPTVQLTRPSLYLTSADIARARRNIKQFAWAAKAFEHMRQSADTWAAKPDAELRALFPEQGALFAYGFAGCPECHATWPTWGSGGLCDLSRPKTAKCTSYGHIFPDAQHPDDGRGWKNPADGRMHYFVGCSNTYVIQQVGAALDDLSTTYAITGDERYAHAAAVLFDQMAIIYPTCTVGSIDYPNAPGGRFERTLYQVARMLVHYAREYDLLFNSPTLDQPSAIGGTIHQNIEDNVLRNGAAYCWKQSRSAGAHTLSNGSADYVRGVMAVGILLDIQNYMDWVLTGPVSIFSFIENCLDRDGHYYETATGYSQYALSIYVDMAEMLCNYRSAKYPRGINLYDLPRFRRALVEAWDDLDCAGHDPRFGDASPDVAKLEQVTDYRSYLHQMAERLYARADASQRKHWASLLNRICEGDVEARRGSGLPGWYLRWLLFHAERVPRTKPAPTPTGCSLLGAKGITVLRSGSGPDAQAALLRFGPSLGHGHYDDLNLNYFGLGRELTYDLGYSLGTAHVQVGWSKQTASHNLVVVNETPQLKTGPCGGAATLFAAFPGGSAVEASAEHSYTSEGVRLYRRTLAMVDLAPGTSYLLDIFRVAGGRSHDLMWHGIGTLEVPEEVGFGPTQEKGSLAGEQFDWGRQVGPDGDITSEITKGPAWMAPPGNGYGFLHSLRRAPAGEKVLPLAWRCDERSEDRFRVTLLAPPDSELVTAHAPGILPKLPGANYAILRRKGEDLSSSFVSILEPTAGDSAITSVERIPEADIGTSDTKAVGVRVSTKDGHTDYLFSDILTAEGCRERTYRSGDKQFTISGQLAMLTERSGKPASAVLIGGQTLVGKEIELHAKSDSYSGTIAKLDYSANRLTTSTPLPTDGSLVGQAIYFSRPEYSRTTVYRIVKVSKTRDGRYEISLGGASPVLGRGVVGQEQPTNPQAISAPVPLPFAVSCTWKDTGYFQGKLMADESNGKTTQIEQVLTSERALQVCDPQVVNAGDRFIIYDLQAGDEFRIANSICLTVEGRAAHLTTTTLIELRLSGKQWSFEPGEHRIRL